MGKLYINHLGELIYISGDLETNIKGFIYEDMWLFDIK